MRLRSLLAHVLFTALFTSGWTLAQPSPHSAAPSHPKAAASLENTHWQLVRLGNMPVMTDSQRQQPYLTFDAKSLRMTGSGGCNRLTGSYKRNGDQLTFGQIASTRMACVQGMETENAFLQALQHVTTWKIAGNQLELLDAAGNLVARFEAHPTN
jgi:heat shock protein HslJ